MDKKIQKSDKREYTLKIIPHQGETVRSIRLPIRTIKYSLAALCASIVLFVGAFGYSTYSASQVRQDQSELEELRQVNTIQQTQILQLSKKANTLQEDMEHLNQLEAEIRQLASIDGPDSAKKESEGQPPAHDGQGGPVIQPNVQNLNDALNSIDKDIKTRRESLESLKAMISQKRAQIAVTPSIWPTSGDVSSRYGLRWNGSDFHPGVDIANDVGTPVVATADGVVTSSEWNSGGYGNMIDIDHGNGIVTRYAHNARLAVGAGTAVKKGQVIAYMGSTGFSTGPHVHYEVIVNGKAVNPNTFL